MQRRTTSKIATQKIATLQKLPLGRATTSGASGILFSLLLLSGCAAYERSRLTPDSFNYTIAVDHDPMRVDQHWFGFSWNLKR